ncbi:MAG: methanogenesis marker 16 metalloprotein [Methanophagales archaeon ANME-1-THS]|nr:MAG: methanogenesis marker 16 metalloprotein [Methanophagales archaeon ANME-1-THS]
MEKRRTIAEINAKLENGEGVIMTAEELCNRLRSGEDIRFEDVDVVTSATCGVMSGTYAILSFQVAEREAFERATTILLNGVPGFVGPCPNERLGVVDLLVYGTSHANERYGGGHLFRDLVAQKEIEVAVGTVEGRSIKTTTSLEEIPVARLCSTRNAFKNYYAFVNAHENAVSSIFGVDRFKGPFKELTFSGCGELNPLEKDPFRETIGIGTKILMNGAVGFVIGEGTRSSPEKPNLMGIADMHGMFPEFLGGFRTAAGPEVFYSWAVPIPIVNEHVLENAGKRDEEIRLGVLDIHNRLPVGEITYADVWHDFSVRFDRSACLECDECQVASSCPADAFDGEAKEVHEDFCCNCGTCVQVCKGGAFSCNLGVVHLSGREIPVTLRQSDRKKAVKLAEMLKSKILDGEFVLAEPVSRL